MTADLSDQPVTPGPSVFERVLVGVDPSPASVEAARQAALLSMPGGTLTILCAWRVPTPSVGVVAPATADELELDLIRHGAEEAVAAARAAVSEVANPKTTVVRGVAWEALIEEAEREKATVIVAGSHGQGRLRGIVMGSTATEVIHKAPSSVLIARASDAQFPQRIIVGVDGSPESAAAYEAARELRERFDGKLWPIAARGGADFDKAAVETIVGHRYEDLPDEPATALVAASAEADVVVVGSRGLHGWKALGSVSERVAHEARASVLIVR